MKIALIQPDVRQGRLEENLTRIIAFGQKAAAAGASLCLLPDDALLGPDGGLSWRQADFAQLARLASFPLPLICHLPRRPGHVLFLAGLERPVVGTVSLHGYKIGAEDAEDADILLLGAGSPFAPGSQRRRENALAARAVRERRWLMTPNLCGGYGGTVYNGQSLAVRPDGAIHCRGLAFSEDVLICDLRGAASLAAPCAGREEEQWRALVSGTRDFVHKAGAARAILGLSGGMDSAFVACVAAQALGAENVTGVLMPSPYSSPGSLADSLELAANLGIATYTVPIEDILKVFSERLGPVLTAWAPGVNDLTHENLQARIRGVILMAAANRSGALVLNTGNKSEACMGYCTLYGDTVGAVAVIGDLYKTRVYELARWYCDWRGEMVIPRAIFIKPPSAELRPNQKDTDSLPPYPELDACLAALCDGALLPENISGDKLDEIRGRVAASRFKRAQCPPPLLVS